MAFGLKQCAGCGSENMDADLRCGVCGGNLPIVSDAVGVSGAWKPVATPPRRQVQWAGVVGLSVGSGLIVGGYYFMFVLTSVPDLQDFGMSVGSIMLMIGIITIASVLTLFKGLPYARNVGWHKGGDPDMWAESVTGSRSSSYEAYLADRNAEAREKTRNND